MAYRICLLISLTLIPVFIFTSCNSDKKTGSETSDSVKVGEDNSNQLHSEVQSARSLGLAYLEENDLENAEKQFIRVKELAPESADGYANLGVVYLRQGKYPEAESMLEKASVLAPQDPEIRINLAKAYELNEKVDESLLELQKGEESSPEHVQTLYNLAEKYEEQSDENSVASWGSYMQKIVQVAPSNIVARLYLTEALIRSNKGSEALKNLEEMQQISPEFPPESREYFIRSMELLQTQKEEEALTQLLYFHNILKLTPEYQAGIRELKGSGNDQVGVPVISFQKGSTVSLSDDESILDYMTFSDATSSAGLNIINDQISLKANSVHSIISGADMDNDGDFDLYVSGYESDRQETFRYLLQSDFGRYKDITSGSGISHAGKDLSSGFSDYDNDGFLDIFVCTPKEIKLYRNIAEGTFSDVTSKSKLAGQGIEFVFLDLDQEGDLDLLLARKEANILFRNNGDGTFLKMDDQQTGLRAESAFTDIGFGDIGNDGDLDLVVIYENGEVQVLSNLRSGKFQDITNETGIDTSMKYTKVEVSDFNNDGLLDIFLITINDGVRLFQNDEDGKYNLSEFSNAINQEIEGIVVKDVSFFDFDNDGFVDLLLAGQHENPNERGVVLLHNEIDGFKNVTHLLPEGILSGRNTLIADYNQDGDLDIFLTEMDGKVRLIRNDGGNANRHINVKLVGLRTGSGKNNYFGIGSTIEVRAGDLYQKKVITHPGIHFGLGNREKADVVRILWTNGVAQNIFSPGSDQDLIEEQELKGSCPFLYTWNGEEFVFVKDMMWRSALGMPLGIMGEEKKLASPEASREYLLIPGELIQKKDDELLIQMTSELWETIYSDQIELIAVDHPSNKDIYVDEKFVVPPYPELKIYQVEKQQLPVLANDERRNDLMDLISRKDHQYVSNFQRGKYQGITELHDLIIDLGRVEETNDLHLFMNGWIFPTDASINVALSQSDDLNIRFPSLEVINKEGKWQEVSSNIGFPSGKNKTVIVDLSDKFLSEQRKIRIRTNMEIYWDHVFFAKAEKAEVKMKRMKPKEANLHYRGFSSKYKQGDQHGPDWFDYNEVSKDIKWRHLSGNYTKYGDVTDLLQRDDNMYVISNAGDEITISFDAKQLPELQNGWERDYLIYSVGWVKDGDLNTVSGFTVDPLPFHRMKKYPYGDDEHYPDDDQHNEYLQKYNTRVIDNDSFINDLKTTQ